ncbi:MAG TPA: ATP synthase subunit I [Steroidobacteraceae bacterium]|nr:ATP synthase subunit I [Steroidobacteraceae bacterium]
MAIVIDLPAAKRLAFGVVRGQAAVTAAAALAGYAIGGPHAAISCALGGGIGTIASLGMALMAFGGKAPASPARILGTFYAGEVVKVVLAIISFILVLKLTGASPLPMFAAYMATFLVYWIVLARMALPAQGRSDPDRAATRRARA